MSPDTDIYSTISFPLGSRPAIEPPKEKPPPPPLELSDDDSEKPELPPKPSLRRLDSTKRIKKEIRKKRSDFLGIDGLSDDSYLDPGKKKNYLWESLNTIYYAVNGNFLIFNIYNIFCFQKCMLRHLLT